MACILAEESRRQPLTRCCWSKVLAVLLGRLKGPRRKDEKDGRIDGEKRSNIDKGKGAKREMEIDWVSLFELSDCPH